VPTHKRPVELARALRSIYAQSTTRRLQVVVVNDSPELSIEDAVGVAPPHVEVETLTTSGGIGGAAARNLGIERARGELVLFLDDDDEWLPAKVERFLDAFADDAVVVVASRYECRRGDSSKFVGFQRAGTLTLAELLSGNILGGCSFVGARLSALREVGGFDATLTSCQDYDLWLRLALRHPDGVRYLSEPLARYHDHHGARITSNLQAVIAGRLALAEKMRPLLDAASFARFAGFVSAGLLFRTRETGVRSLPALVAALHRSGLLRHWRHALRPLAGRALRELGLRS
jgi:GT2 family glycosyltransferase